MIFQQTFTHCLVLLLLWEECFLCAVDNGFGCVTCFGWLGVGEMSGRDLKCASEIGCSLLIFATKIKCLGSQPRRKERSIHRVDLDLSYSLAPSTVNPFQTNKILTTWRYVSRKYMLVAVGHWVWGLRAFLRSICWQQQADKILSVNLETNQWTKQYVVKNVSTCQRWM